MALPINTMPTFNLKVPSTGKTIRYRPFVVKEEKALLIAHQSEDLKVMIDTLKNVIKSCVLDELNVDDLAVFDIEYIFTRIRGKSVGETIELLFPCDTDHGEQNKKAVSKVVVDINAIDIIRGEGHNNKIDLFGDVGIVMKYPSIDIAKKLENEDGTLKTRPEVLHAETNAIAKLARSSESGLGSTLFVTHTPCLDCAKIIYQSGIKHVYYATDYRDDSGIAFLRDSGIEVQKISI